MNDFVNMRGLVVNLLGLIAEAGERSPGTRCVIHRASIVLAELDEYEIARFCAVDELVPKSFGHISATALPAACGVHPVRFLRIDMGERFSPAGVQGIADLRGESPARKTVGSAGSRLQAGWVAGRVACADARLQTARMKSTAKAVFFRFAESTYFFADSSSSRRR